MTKEATPNAQVCHNCRRARVKCDGTVPRCTKCVKRGQECMGYQRMLRWEKGVASRGKMMGVHFGETAVEQANKVKQHVLHLKPLADPLLQNMNTTDRKYLSYFASAVCKDLVLYDTPKDNPFRELIPLTREYPILLNIIIANSAIHMSNAGLDIKSFNSTSVSPQANSSEHRRGSPAPHQIKAYQDSLAAKYKALYLLQTVLTSKASQDIDVTLAVVLLFIEFELLESGRDNWAHHINGARTIIERLCGPALVSQTLMTPLRSFLISNCLVFDILGSTMASKNGLTLADTLPTAMLSLLQDAEGNHCSSFPTILLQVMQTGARIARTEGHSDLRGSRFGVQQQQISQLLHTAQVFDPLNWATNLQPRSPASDLSHRTHVACAHRAAVCIYLSRILLSLNTQAHFTINLESLVSEAISHMSHIRPSDPLFTATTWPAFIAGAETNKSSARIWVVHRFREIWEIEPWGSVRGALEVLRAVWAERKDAGTSRKEGENCGETDSEDWVGRLRQTGVDWLII